MIRYKIVSDVYVICLISDWSLAVLFQNNSTLIVLKDNVIKMLYPWASNKYLVHSTSVIQSSTATTSVSSELHVFNFWFVELSMVNPLTVDRPPLVSPLIFWCTAKDISIRHFIIPLPLALRISSNLLVPLIYFIRCTNMVQLSLLGSLTLMVRNETAVHVSDLARLVSNNIVITRGWNSTACLVLSFLYSLSTFKIIADVALDLVPLPVRYTLSKAFIISLMSCSSPKWDNLPSGNQRYPLKGFNLGYMYWGQNTLLNKLKHTSTCSKKWCMYWYVFFLGGGGG